MAWDRSSSASPCSISLQRSQPSRLTTTRPGGSGVIDAGYLRGGGGARLMPCGTRDLDVDFIWVAMNSTVVMGTSPTAVTW